MAGIFDRTRLWALIPAIILWGCFGGICFVAVCFITHYIGLQSSISCFSAIALPLWAPWIFGTAILLSLVWGMVAADLFCTGRKTDLHPVLLGLLSGICMALVGYTLVDIFHILTWMWPNGPLDVLRVYLIGWMNDYVLYIIILGIPQVFGAWYQASRQKSNGDAADTTSSPKGITGTRHRHWFFLVALLVFLLVIPMSIYVLPVDETQYCGSGDSCMRSDYCGREPPEFDNVTVSRTGPDSIRVSLKASSKNCGSRNSFKILLNGFDISNQDLISKTGLNVTITPRNGLGRQDGAAATLQGSDITGNETSLPHIQVVIIIPDIPAPFVQRDLYL